MKDILNKLYNYQTLERKEAKAMLINISEGKYNVGQVTSFMTVFLMRSITVEELAGFRESLLELCLKVEFNGLDTIDLCGTGGDGKDTFNISTIASFVVAGAGYKVAKHGNYSASSMCGSSNIIESFGAKLSNQQDKLQASIDKANICYLHAPLFHPAMKFVAPIRRELGVKTFFNMLGPLVNPSNPQNQLIGVYSLETARLYNYLFQTLKKNYSIVHSIDGYDEISLTSDYKVFNNNIENLFNSQSFDFQKINPIHIKSGQDINEAKEIFINVLNNKATKEQIDVVVINSAFAIKCFRPNNSIEDCIEEARQSIIEGKAIRSFNKFIDINS